MIYQNQLNKEIKDIACYYTSIAFARELNQKYKWTVEELNTTFNLCKLARYIDKDDCIYNPQGVASILQCKITFVGKFYPENYKPNPNHYVIGCWKLNRETDKAHFVVMNNSGLFTKENVLFDPWENGSNTVEKGICTSLRVFKV